MKLIKSALGGYKIFKNEEGFTLAYILLLALLITTLLYGLFSMLIVYKRIEAKQINRKKLELACTSAVQNILSDTIGMKDYEKNILIDSINVALLKKSYGMFYKLIASAKRGNDSAGYMCFLGAHPDTLYNNAVVITNPNLNCVLADNVTIKGDIISSAKRYNKERIPAKNNGPALIDGKFKQSLSLKQKDFNESFILNGYASFNRTAYDMILNEDININRASINNYLGRSIRTSGKVFISGNLNFYSYRSINIKCSGPVYISDSTRTNIYFSISTDSSFVAGSGCIINNMVLFSSKGITVAKGNILGNTQLISKSNIEISGSLFNYPSLICLYNVDIQKNPDSFLKINKSVINGACMLVTAVTGVNSNRSKIKIDYESAVKGFIYSENFFETGSKLFGCASFFNLYYYKSPTEYINWLTDLYIDREKLDNNFILPAGFSKDMRYEILSEKWIF